MSKATLPFPFFRIILPALVALLTLPSSAVEPVRIVATGGRIAYTFYTPAAANTAFRQRTPHKLGGPVTEMQVGFMDWMYPSDKAETFNDDNDVTIEYAWLERATTGQIVPLTFNSQRSLVLPKNSTTPYWLSDAVPSLVWTGNPPARDEIFWLHVKGSIPTGGKTPVGTPATYPGSKCIFYPPANDPGTHDLGGAVPTISGSTSRIQGLPLIFLGRFTGPGHLSVIGVGDSIMDGTGDVSNPVPVISGYGFFNRAALDTNGANTIATFNLTRHGQTANSFKSQQRQPQFLKFANIMAEEYGTNDIGQNGTGDPTTTLTNVEGIWTAARTAGVQKIVRTLLMPRTESTNQWIDSAGQTPNTGWGAGGKRDTFNDGLTGAKAAGKIDVLVDTLAIMADPLDNHLWLTNGTANYTAADTTHLSRSGNALLAPHLRNALLSLTVDADRPDYIKWSSGVNWEGKDSSPNADPDGDGVKNLLAYSLAISPLTSASPGSLPTSTTDRTTPGGPWLAFTYRENLKTMDLIRTVEMSSDLVAWTTIVPDGTTAISETVSADVDGNGTAALRRVRIKAGAEGGPRFMRLRVLY